MLPDLLLVHAQLYPYVCVLVFYLANCGGLGLDALSVYFVSRLHRKW